MEAALLDARVDGLESVVATALGDLAGWLDTLGEDVPPEVVLELLRQVSPAVVQSYGDVAATLAADWYMRVRPEGAGRFTAAPTAPASIERQVDDLVSWAARPLIVEGDRAAAFSLLAGGVQRLVAAHDRETVTAAATADPAATAWVRRTSADACAFCAYMAVAMDPARDREDVHKYHDRCRCVPVPLFSADDDVMQPRRDDYQGAVDEARRRLVERRESVGYDQIRRGRRPKELALTTRNILAGMREQGYR